MKVFKGGYKIVSLLNIDITSDFTISGIYDDIKDSHGKPILVSEINVGGEKMNDAYTIVKQVSTDYIIEVYGYSLTIASDDSVTVASLPEITSIGDGLTLEDGELSSSGGKTYTHMMGLSKYGGADFVVNFISSSNTPTTFKEFMEKIRNTTPETETLEYCVIASGIYSSNPIIGLKPYSATMFQIKTTQSTAGLNYADYNLDTYVIVEN